MSDLNVSCNSRPTKNPSIIDYLREDSRFSASALQSRTNAEGDRITECPLNEVQIIRRTARFNFCCTVSVYCMLYWRPATRIHF